MPIPGGSRAMGAARVIVATVIVAGGIAGAKLTNDGGDPPVGDGVAHLWIDANGGTCTRSSSAVEYADASACDSVDDAYTAASGGDTIRTVDDLTFTTGQSCSGAKGSVVTLIGGENAQIDHDLITSTLSISCTNFTIDNLDVNGNTPQIYINGGTENFTWKNSSKGPDIGERSCNEGDAENVPTQIYSDGDMIDGVTLYNVVLGGPNLKESGTGCPGDVPHMEDIRIDQNVTDITLDKVTFQTGESNTATIYITTPNSGTYEPDNITIRNSKFYGSDSPAHIAWHGNVNCVNVTIAYNTFTAHEPIQWGSGAGCTSHTNTLMVGNIGWRPQTCFSGVTWTKNVWQWSVGTPCGTDTRVDGSNFSIDQLDINATTLDLDAGSPGINAGETPGASDYCTGDLGSVDRDGAVRPAGSVCDAGADERE